VNSSPHIAGQVMSTKKNNLIAVLEQQTSEGWVGGQVDGKGETEALGEAAVASGGMVPEGV